MCPFSSKVRFALELLKLDFEYIEIDLMTGRNREEFYLKINPAGRVPSMTL